MDKSVLLCSVVYCKTINAVEHFGEVQTAQANKFVQDILFDEANNLNGILYVKGNKHTITFNRQSRSSRGFHQLKIFVKLKKNSAKLRKQYSTMLRKT